MVVVRAHILVCILLWTDSILRVSHISHGSATGTSQCFLLNEGPALPNVQPLPRRNRHHDRKNAHPPAQGAGRESATRHEGSARQRVELADTGLPCVDGADDLVARGEYEPEYDACWGKELRAEGVQVKEIVKSWMRFSSVTFSECSLVGGTLRSPCVTGFKNWLIRGLSAYSAHRLVVNERFLLLSLSSVATGAIDC